MQTRSFGNTGIQVSEVGLGCWQLGSTDWGVVDDKESDQILRAAMEQGVRFLDTADVYGGGQSERRIGKLLREINDDVFVATKIGRQNFPGPYTMQTTREHITDCIGRLGVESLDLVQWHCIPPAVMNEGSVFDWMRELKQEGLIRNFGASVESVDEALSIVDEPGLTSLQIIFNLFRQKPIESLLDRAQSAGVGIIVRLPLASGLLSGKMTRDTRFDETDHRNYNRDGQAFNVGETFAGLPLSTGLDLVERLRQIVPPTISMASFAQRWILDHEAVSTVITGASRPSQVTENASVSDLPPLESSLHELVAKLYRDEVHDAIRGLY